MNKQTEEWIKQAEYDMDVAEFLFKGAKYSYTVFMRHLSIEKALKGFYAQILNEEPPKIHNLIYLVGKIGLNFPVELQDFIIELSGVSITARYPDDLSKTLSGYNKSITNDILIKSKRILEWIKTQLSVPSNS